VEIHVLQGERKMAAHNKSIGRFHLDGIPPAPRGVPQIEVTFDIDANGILHVSAKDLGTGKEQKITITASSGLSEGDIKNMVKDAEKFADEDQKSREAAETFNHADNLVYQTEKLLKEHGSKVPDEKKTQVETAIKALKDAIKGKNPDEIKAKMEELNNVVQAMSAELYSQAKTQAHDKDGKPNEGEGGPSEENKSKGGAGKGGDDAIDADFEMVDDKNKK
jgi:molecular chaperone DnaK